MLWIQVSRTRNFLSSAAESVFGCRLGLLTSRVCARRRTWEPDARMSPSLTYYLKVAQGITQPGEPILFGKLVRCGVAVFGSRVRYRPLGS